MSGILSSPYEQAPPTSIPNEWARAAFTGGTPSNWPVEGISSMPASADPYLSGSTQNIYATSSSPVGSPSVLGPTRTNLTPSQYSTPPGTLATSVPGYSLSNGAEGYQSLPNEDPRSMTATTETVGPGLDMGAGAMSPGPMSGMPGPDMGAGAMSPGPMSGMPGPDMGAGAMSPGPMSGMPGPDMGAGAMSPGPMSGMPGPGMGAGAMSPGPMSGMQVRGPGIGAGDISPGSMSPVSSASSPWPSEPSSPMSLATGPKQWPSSGTYGMQSPNYFGMSS
uniref:Uncharacterized protein n=1 Tax=viral metagenome TaxID=1070528 RepID=A0A6C0C0T7_9ZZZZ